MPGETGTHSPRLRRPVLYPVELRARVTIFRGVTSRRYRTLLQKYINNKTGRGGGIRTHDPLLPKQMRYQAALRPEEARILQTRTTAVNQKCVDFEMLCIYLDKPSPSLGHEQQAIHFS